MLGGIFVKLYRCYSERMYEYFIEHGQEKLLKAKDIKTNAILYAFEETEKLKNLREQYNKEILHK
jgi:hypothetical protein